MTGNDNGDGRQFYISQVQQEIADHDKYHRNRIRAYRSCKLLVIIAAGLVPVLASVEGTPNWVLGSLGGIAAATEACQQLFQLRRSALQAMRTGNRLAREMRLYTAATGPYSIAASQAFEQFAIRVEDIRNSAEDAFFDTWQQGIEADASLDSKRLSQDRSQ